MSTTKEDRSFKTLINRETTDSVNKFFFNEFGADTINVHANDIWSETIPLDDPATAIIIGRAEQHTLFVMTEDPTVPNAQAWKAVDPAGDINNSRLKDWISPKFGDSYTVRLFDNNDIEIFTTDPVDWFFDYQTGILTFNGNALSKARPFKITGYRYVGLKGVAGAQVSATNTLEDFIIPVDWNDPSAVDPPTGTIWSNQDQVDDFLALNGASSVKHIEAAWDAIAPLVLHNIDIVLPAGVHRVHSTKLGTLSNKTVLPGGSIELYGAPPADYIVLEPSETVTARQLETEMGSLHRDPWVEVAGTPYTPGALKGFFVVFDSGLVAIIRDNTSNRIFLVNELTPAPTVGVTTFFVGKPSTIFRNSIDDISAVDTGFFISCSIGNVATSGLAFGMFDFGVENFGAGAGVIAITSAGRFTRILIDHDQSTAFGKTPDGRGIQVSGNNSGIVSLTSVSVRCNPASRGASEAPLAIFAGRGVSAIYFFAHGVRDGLFAQGGASEPAFTLTCFVIDDVGTTGPAIDLFAKATFSFEQHASFSKGVANIIKNHPHASTAAFRLDGLDCRMSRTDVQQLLIETSAADGVIIGNRTHIDMTTTGTALSRGWRTGVAGGITGVGIRFLGTDNSAIFSPNTDLAGAGGQIEIDGLVSTYADLLSVSPLITERLNRVTKL